MKKLCYKLKAVLTATTVNCKWHLFSFLNHLVGASAWDASARALCRLHAFQALQLAIQWLSVNGDSGATSLAFFQLLTFQQL